MLLITVSSVFVLVFSLYLAMDAWAYRRPWILLVFGLLVSALSVLIKGTPQILKSAPKLPWSVGELDLAASVVDPTLIGLSGGLIASAFVLKLQILHARDLRNASDGIAHAVELLDSAARADADLKLVARSLSDDEFKTRLEKIRSQQMRALDRKHDAEKKLKNLSVPGLGGDT